MDTTLIDLFGIRVTAWKLVGFLFPSGVWAYNLYLDVTHKKKAAG